MKLFKVKVEYETVIAAASEAEAQMSAKNIVRRIDDEPTEWDVEEIDCLYKLPYGWKSDYLPWDGDGTKTIKEYLEQQ